MVTAGNEQAPGERAGRLASVRTALLALGPRPCRWPACDRDAVPVGGRGPGEGPGSPASGGRRPEFCSQAHKEQNARAVRDLGRLLRETRSLRAQAPVREHKAVDAALSEITARLALHGEPLPDPPDGGSCPADSAPAARRGLRGPAARAGRPVLALRDTTDPGQWEADWEFLRDANDASRQLSDRVSRARTDADRRRLVADAWKECADVAQAAEQVVAGLVRLRE